MLRGGPLAQTCREQIQPVNGERKGTRAINSPQHELTTISRSIIQNASRTREAVPVGPFTALIHPVDAAPWFNYAAVAEPGADAPALRAALADLRGLFRQRQRRLRFEYVEALSPVLADILEEQGLCLESRCQLMLCLPDWLQYSPAPDVHCRLLVPDDPALPAALEAQRAAFGMEPFTSPAEELARVRAEIAEGAQQMGVAEIAGQAAAGACLMAAGGVAELAGVGTHPDFRRRGAALSLAGFLTGSFFQQGGRMVWLGSGGDASTAVYEKAGFRWVGVQLNYVEPEDA